MSFLLTFKLIFQIEICLQRHFIHSFPLNLKSVGNRFITTLLALHGEKMTFQCYNNKPNVYVNRSVKKHVLSKTHTDHFDRPYLNWHSEKL